MLFDIRRRENGLKIEPHGLHFDPILREVESIKKPVLPVLYLCLENFGVGATLHCLGLDNLIIEDLLHFIDRSACHDEGACISPFFQLHLDGCPIILHLLDDLFNSKLLLGVLRDDLKLSHLFEDLVYFH
jgi:hypothetical protein